MTLVRMIAPQWLMDQEPGIKKVIEGEFSEGDIFLHNSQGYNVYYLPNHPRTYEGGTVEGGDIDVFNYVFVDFDLKSNTYSSKEVFIATVGEKAPAPSRIVDSGNGIHVYWKVTDLDAKSYLRLTRRMMRLLNTDPAVGQIFQLMRLPETMNTKDRDNALACEALYEAQVSYTCEELDKALPPIQIKDEEHCIQHYNKTHKIEQESFSDAIPAKFAKILKENPEIKDIWLGTTNDRSKNDYRLGHLLYGNDFTREEAASVLMNTAKALSRSPAHRASYATNIIDKIWTFEQGPEEDKLDLSESVTELLQRSGDTLKGTPFRCHKRIDNTEHGFRLGQVIGLVAGSGVGKTTFALNMFKWFTERNPDYHHFFIPLEQTSAEIADRWQTLCGKDTALHSKVHIMSNYDKEGNFRHLSFSEIRAYIEKFQKVKGVKIGCVVIDHIGALKKKGAEGENQDLMEICHSMKAFAVQTNTLLVMQSQTSRSKAGIGDLELDKDAAYGTMYFEAYCDYLITVWQPLKRCHAEQSCPTVTAFKFCKIRHKKPRKDVIQEDVPYFFYFDSDKEILRDMTQSETVSFNFFLDKATKKRAKDKKTELVEYQSVPYEGGVDGKATRFGHSGSH
jgi:DnaB helicase-like protein